jgi:TonB family protein
VYGDDMSFCLEDGTPLAEPHQYQQATESYSAQEQPTVEPGSIESTQRPGIFETPRTAEVSTAPPRKSSNLVILLIAVFAFGTLFVIAGLIGGWYLLAPERSLRSSANSNTGYPNENMPIAPANTSITTNATPDPIRTDHTEDSNSIKNSDRRAGNANVVRSSPSPQPSLKTDDKDKRADVSPPPYPSPKASAPRTISAGVLNGKAISLPKPPYPPAARAVRASGSVSVQVLIDESGRVISATAVSGHPLLQAAAVAAARQARFSPTMLSGQSVKVSGVITYNFVP